MKKHWILAMVLIIAVSASACQSKAPIAPPEQQAPDTAGQEAEKADTDMIPVFTSMDLSGNEVSLDFFADSKITLVNVWTTT